MMSDEDTRVSKYQGTAAGDAPSRVEVWGRSRLHRARDPEDRPRVTRPLRGAGAAAQGLSVLSRRHSAPAGAHQVRWRGASPGERRHRHQRPVDHIRHLLRCRFSLPVGHAERWQKRAAGQRRLQRTAQAAQPRRSPESDVGILRCARQVPRDVRIHAELADSGRHLLARARDYKTSLEAALDGTEHPDGGVHAASGRREQTPADVPPLPEAAAEDDGTLRAPLLRPLCAARRNRRPDYTPEQAQKHVLDGAQTAWPRLRLRRDARLQRALDRLVCRPKANAPEPTRTAAPTMSIPTC